MRSSAAAVAMAWRQAAAGSGGTSSDSFSQSARSSIKAFQFSCAFCAASRLGRGAAVAIEDGDRRLRDEQISPSSSSSLSSRLSSEVSEMVTSEPEELDALLLRLCCGLLAGDLLLMPPTALGWPRYLHVQALQLLRPSSFLLLRPSSFALLPSPEVLAAISLPESVGPAQSHTGSVGNPHDI